METGLSADIREKFQIPKKDIRQFSPLALAYVGDAVYELVIRTAVLCRGNMQPSRLHRETSRYSKAQAQSAMMETLLPVLPTEETDIYRRGRNAKSYTTAKHASISDYRRATGFEALMGYLYLNDDMPRLLELVHEAASKYQPPEHAGAEARNRCE